MLQRFMRGIIACLNANHCSVQRWNAFVYFNDAEHVYLSRDYFSEQLQIINFCKIHEALQSCNGLRLLLKLLGCYCNDKHAHADLCQTWNEFVKILHHCMGCWWKDWSALLMIHRSFVYDTITLYIYEYGHPADRYHACKCDALSKLCK